MAKMGTEPDKESKIWRLAESRFRQNQAGPMCPNKVESIVLIKFCIYLTYFSMSYRYPIEKHNFIISYIIENWKK